MIYITGDKHGQLEPFLENKDFKKIKKGDVLIVCGDFGFLWDNSKQEYKNLKWLSKRKYVVAFLDGCYDNISLISKYPISVWNEGHVRFISKNIVYLMQGEIFNIAGTKVLTFGGGFEEELTDDFENNNWWPEKFTNRQCVDNVIENIGKENGKVDLIVSHEAPAAITPCLQSKEKENNAINLILEEIRLHCKFKRWFFSNII